MNNFEEKLKNDLTKQGVDISPGGVLHDLFLRKHIEITLPLNERIEKLLKTMNFRNFEDLSMEDLLLFAGNFFVDVQQGGPASGYVRLFFPTPTDIVVPNGTIFSDENEEIRFLSTPPEGDDPNQKIRAEEMVDNVSGFHYYFDVWLEAEDIGNIYNVDVGVITRCNNSVITSQSTKIENVDPFRDGSDAESASSLYHRTKNSLAVRNLANDPSIRTVIMNQFPSVNRVYVVPTSSNEMQRDRIIVLAPDSSPIEVQVGNMSDVYVETTRELFHTAIAEKGVDEAFDFGYDQTGEVVFRVLNVYPSNIEGDITGDALSESDWSFDQLLYHENSVQQASTITIPGNTDVGYFMVEYMGTHYISDIQDYIWSPTVRMPVGDMLIKGFNLSLLSGTISYRGDIGLTDMTMKMREFLCNCEGSVLEISDIVNALYSFGANKVSLPINLTMKKYDNTEETFDNYYELENSEAFALHPEFYIVRMEG